MYMQGGQMYQFQEEDLESFLDTCISYESQGKKVSECNLQLNYNFLINSLETENANNSSSNTAKEAEVVVALKSVDKPDELKSDTNLPDEKIYPSPPQGGGFTLKNDILIATFGETSA